MKCLLGGKIAAVAKAVYQYTALMAARHSHLTQPAVKTGNKIICPSGGMYRLQLGWLEAQNQESEWQLFADRLCFSFGSSWVIILLFFPRKQETQLSDVSTVFGMCHDCCNVSKSQLALTKKCAALISHEMLKICQCQSIIKGVHSFRDINEF